MTLEMLQPKTYLWHHDFPDRVVRDRQGAWTAGKPQDDGEMLAMRRQSVELVLKHDFDLRRVLRLEARGHHDSIRRRSERHEHRVVGIRQRRRLRQPLDQIVRKL